MSVPGALTYESVTEGGVTLHLKSPDSHVSVELDPQGALDAAASILYIAGIRSATFDHGHLQVHL